MRTKRHISQYLVALLPLAVLLAGCSSDVRPEIVAGVDACSECNMIIDTPAQACGFVDGSTFVTFDSPACLLRNYETRRRLGQETPAEVVARAIQYGRRVRCFSADAVAGADGDR